VDREGNEHEDDAHGFLSTVVQHEVDHLNGKLFIDYLDRVKRRMTMKKYKKARKKLERNDELN
jgi:peptide deformylase